MIPFYLPSSKFFCLRPLVLLSSGLCVYEGGYLFRYSLNQPNWKHPMESPHRNLNWHAQRCQGCHHCQVTSNGTFCTHRVIMSYQQTHVSIWRA